jgi:hypothetical protein
MQLLLTFCLSQCRRFVLTRVLQPFIDVEQLTPTHPHTHTLSLSLLNCLCCASALRCSARGHFCPAPADAPGTLPNATQQGYIDYRDVYALALSYMQPTPALPMEAQWEAINLVFVPAVLEKYPQIVALSSQLQVRSEINKHIAEPGNHGSTTSVIPGEHSATFAPLAEPWVNAFQYDCTKQNSSSVLL